MTSVTLGGRSGADASNVAAEGQDEEGSVRGADEEDDCGAVGVPGDEVEEDSCPG